MTIDAAGALQPHDHVVWFGDGRDELSSVATTALADGARRHEKLMLVAEDPDPAMLGGVDGLERMLAVGQLELHPIDAVYGGGTAFSASAQLETFQGVLADALANGYRGIRVVADNTPLVRGDDDGFRRWLAWEQMTDRFQAASLVTGVCFFDRRALSDQRQDDLAAVHPVRSAGAIAPRFSWCIDDDAISVTGTLDAAAAEQFGRILETAPLEPGLVIDLSAADAIDREALRVLVASATASHPIDVRGDAHLRELVSLLGGATPHVRFDRRARGPETCAVCGDWIGVFEPTVIVVDGASRVTSRAADADAVENAAARYHRTCYENR